MSAGITFLAWRVSFQSDEQALKSAFGQIAALSEQLRIAKAQILAIASKSRADFDDSADFQDWAAGEAMRAVAASSIGAGVTRSPGLCVGCGAKLGAPHDATCRFANLLPGRSA